MRTVSPWLGSDGQTHWPLVCRQQFGQPGLRVYRLLVTLRQLEQKQVAEKAMLPTKDTRELLYRMLKAGTISLQARAPSRPVPLTRHCLPSFPGAYLHRAVANISVRVP